MTIKDIFNAIINTPISELGNYVFLYFVVGAGFYFAFQFFQDRTTQQVYRQMRGIDQPRLKPDEEKARKVRKFSRILWTLIVFLPFNIFNFWYIGLLSWPVSWLIWIAHIFFIFGFVKARKDLKEGKV